MLTHHPKERKKENVVCYLSQMMNDMASEHPGRDQNLTNPPSVADEAVTLLLPIGKDRKPFQCGMCCVSFDIIVELKMHVQQHALTKPFQCGFCKVSYDTDSELTVHIDSHQLFVCVAKGSLFHCPQEDHDKNSMQNQLLDADFKSKLAENVKIDQDSISSQDSALSPTATDSGKTWDARKNTHRKLESKCVLPVNTSTRQSPVRATDIQSHTETFSCCICRQSFKLQVDLKKHSIEEHCDDRPFHCSRCPSCFKQNNHLLDHMNSVHRSHKPFVCPFCGDRFKIKSYLKHHMARKHRVDSSASVKLLHSKPKSAEGDLGSGAGEKNLLPRKTAVFISESRLSYDDTEFEIALKQGQLPLGENSAAGRNVPANGSE